MGKVQAQLVCMCICKQKACAHLHLLCMWLACLGQEEGYAMLLQSALQLTQAAQHEAKVTCTCSKEGRHLHK